jgi:hypothetical protein
MNDRIPAGGGGDDRRRRPYELARTMALEAPVFARRPRSADSKLLARVGAATAPCGVGVRAVNAPGNLWQGAHTGEIKRRAGDRT